MSNPTWPGGLPQSPLLGSLSMQSQDTRLVFQPDAGQPLRRSRYSAASRAFGFSMMLTTAQLATLDTFYGTTLGNGVLDFDWTDPSTGSTATFSFDKPYKVSGIAAQGLFKVDITLLRAP